jgi:hypothetical protein
MRSAAEKNLAQINAAPTSAKPSELVTDRDYYSRAVLKDLDGGGWKTRIAEPKQQGFKSLIAAVCAGRGCAKKRPQALSGPRCRAQPRQFDEVADRGRNTERGG